MSERRLYLVRHGLADRSAWDGPDERRPLTPAGVERLERSAERLAGLGLGVDLILTSPLTRAVQTADILAAALAPAGGVVPDDRLAWNFGVAALAGLLRDHPGRLLLTGHEPDFSAVAGAVTGGSQLMCKKGSLLRIDLWSEDPPHGELVWLVPPKFLAAD
jgi:phosphohistidine phosphatase